MIAARIASEFKDSNAGWTRARGGGAGATGRRLAAGADGADGRGGIPAADRLRQHGQPAAGAAVEPPARDGGARRARREPLGSGAAGDRREPAAVVRRRRARPGRRVRRTAHAGHDERSAAAADGSDPARWRRAAVHHGDRDRRGARLRLAAGAACVEAGAARRDARIVRQHRRSVRASPAERAGRRRSRPRAGAAGRRGLDDAQLHASCCRSARASIRPTSSPRGCCCRPPSISARRRCASTRT